MELKSIVDDIISRQSLLYTCGLSRGSSVDIAEYYNTVEDAISGVNKVAYGTVGTFYEGDALHIVLLSDITLSNKNRIATNTVLHMNGYTLYMPNNTCFGVANPQTPFVVDASKQGSRLVKVVSQDTYTEDNSSILSNYFIGYVPGSIVSVIGGQFYSEIKDGLQSPTYILSCVNSSANVNTPVGTIYIKDTKIECSYPLSGAHSHYGVLDRWNDLVVDGCSISMIGGGTSLYAIASYGNSVTITNSDIFIQPADIEISGYGISFQRTQLEDGVYVLKDDGKLICKNCHIDVRGSGDTPKGVFSAVCISCKGNIIVDNTYCYGAREGLSIRGNPALLTNSVFEGVEHGGAYLGGKTMSHRCKFRQVDIKVLDDDRVTDALKSFDIGRGGCVYLSQGTEELMTEAYMDECAIECEIHNSTLNHNSGDYFGGIVVNKRYENSTYFLSNVQFNNIADRFDYDIRCDPGKVIYIGENVKYNTSGPSNKDWEAGPEGSAWYGGTMEKELYKDVKFVFASDGEVQYYSKYVPDVV